MDTPLDAASSTAGALFAASTFSVPQFQREYTWEKEEVEEFFTDLARALSDDSYFLGLIIVTGEGQRKDVVDGQQRILTLTLLATALSRKAVQYKRNAVADRLRTTFLRSINFDTDEELPRVSLSDPKDNATLQAILEGESPKYDKDNDQSVSFKLVSAYETLDRLLAEDIQDDPFRRIGTWADFLTNRLYFARFVHPDPGSAYRVFEIINTRGKELTTADLLKSYVLSQTPTALVEQRYDEWQELASSFEGNTATFVQFIRHCVTLDKGHVQPRDLYDVLTGRGRVKRTPVAPETLMKLLELNHPAYTQMVDPTMEGPATTAELSVYATLNAINVVSVRPILLAMRKTPNPDQGAKDLLRLVVRRIVVGSLGTGNVERRFGQTARKIEDDGAWEAALATLSDLNPDRSDFRQRVHHRSLNRNVLTVIRASALQRSITPDLDGYLYQVKPRSADWSQADEDRAAYWASTIGNSFLATEPRRPMGSSSWTGFKTALAPLGVPGEWTQRITSFDRWDIDAIETVGGEIAEVAAEVWYA